MTMTTDVDGLVDRLNWLRSTVLARRAELLAADSRCEDIIWPCEQHDRVGAAEFDSPNTCLVAEALTSQLWVGRPVMVDIATSMPAELQTLAAEWFFLHQLVHVAQGLGYHDFRTLNRVGNRHETMRPDCDADLISIKTLAWLMTTGDTGAALTDQPSGYVACLAYLLDVMAPAMMRLEPNLFIPHRREIELKRMFALLVLRHYAVEAHVAGGPVPDASFFPWWTEDRTRLYMFVGQVHTLGRGAISADAERLSSVLQALEAADIDAAYDQIRTFDWPPLDEAALPKRLVHQP